MVKLSIAKMDKHKTETHKKQQIFHYDENNIENICASLEDEIENLKIVKTQNQTFKTPEIQHFKFALYETETITLLELPSLAPSIKNVSDTQTQVEITENTQYVLPDAVQTLRWFQRTQHTQTESITLEDQSNVASVWILQKEISENTTNLKKKETEPNNFKKILFISDRIVTSNNYSKKQIEFITRHTSDKMNAMSYRYTLDEILQFSNDKFVNFSVTSFVWNTVNEGIFAVGYGRLNKESQNIQGAVCCWSLKNPVFPERTYEFNKAISCLDFSKTNANILIAGSEGGHIYTLDITQEIWIPVIVNEEYLQNFPIWSIVSFLQKSYTSEDEFILSVDGNGSVRKWSISCKTYNTEQMSLIYCGIRNEVDTVKTNKQHNSTIVQNMPGTVVTFHPANKSTYFVGTKVGFVVQNTIDSCNHYDSILTAHNGPVYGIKFSPFCSSIFITYGADWQIKLWMENVESPLLTLCYCNAIDDADWSPINSTVIVSVSGAVICIWDFARKTVEPVMMFTCNTGVHFSLVKFSKHGNNIITGDVNGLVRCFHISNMPSPSFLQTNSILTALENMMSSNQELVRIIKKTLLNK